MCFHVMWIQIYDSHTSCIENMKILSASLALDCWPVVTYFDVWATQFGFLLVQTGHLISKTILLKTKILQNITNDALYNLFISSGSLNLIKAS